MFHLYQAADAVLRCLSRELSAGDRVDVPNFAYLKQVTPVNKCYLQVIRDAESDNVVGAVIHPRSSGFNRNLSVQRF